jgi:hypothetical protein
MKLREAYYQKVLAFERQQMEIREINWMQGVKERLLENE